MLVFLFISIELFCCKCVFLLWLGIMFVVKLLMIFLRIFLSVISFMILLYLFIINVICFFFVWNLYISVCSGVDLGVK